MVAVVALIALLVGFDHRRRGRRLNTRPAVSEFLTLTDDDDGKLFRVRVLNTGEMRVARCHRFAITQGRVHAGGLGCPGGVQREHGAAGRGSSPAAKPAPAAAVSDPG